MGYYKVGVDVNKKESHLCVEVDMIYRVDGLGVSWTQLSSLTYMQHVLVFVIRNAQRAFVSAKTLTFSGCIRVEKGEAMRLHGALSWIK